MKIVIPIALSLLLSVSPDDGWPVSTLETEGMDAEAIMRLTDMIESGRFQGIHSLLIVKNGRLVHEAYFGGCDRETLHCVFSITKSISSALIGIAIEREFIRGVNEPLVSLLPQYADDIRDERAKTITLEHVLTLTSGFEWDEKSRPYNDPRNSERAMALTDDWHKAVIRLPVSDNPGSKWVYNTGSVHLLSGILKARTGKHASEFAEKYLFRPIGITRYDWNTDPNGFPCTGGTYGGLRLRTRDVAKIGHVFMNGGEWNGRRVISEEWVKQSTRRHREIPTGRGFGYLWWRTGFVIEGRRIELIYAAGYGGQSLTLVPELDLMFVFTCWSKSKDADIFGPMIMILKAAMSGEK